MKLSFLFIAGLMMLGLVLISMTERAQLCTTVLDNVSVTNNSTFSTTVYTVERTIGGGGPGTGVTLYGTRTTPPTPNNDGGHNYRCVKSEEICYECSDCYIQATNPG